MLLNKQAPYFPMITIKFYLILDNINLTRIKPNFLNDISIFLENLSISLIVL